MHCTARANCSFYILIQPLMEEQNKDNLNQGINETPDTDNSHKSQSDSPDEQVSKRHAEQMEWARKEVQRLKEIAIEAAVKEASVNAKSLIDLHSKDPKLANEVAKKFNYSSYEEAKKVIDEMDWWTAKQQSSWWLTEEEFEKKFQERYQKMKSEETHQQALSKAYWIINKLPEELRDLATSKFDKAVWKKKLTIEDAVEFAEMATLYVTKDKLKWAKREEALAMLASTWAWNSSNVVSDDDDWKKYVVRNWRLVLVSKSKD